MELSEYLEHSQKLLERGEKTYTDILCDDMQVICRDDVCSKMGELKAPLNTMLSMGLDLLSCTEWTECFELYVDLYVKRFPGKEGIDALNLSAITPAQFRLINPEVFSDFNQETRESIPVEVFANLPAEYINAYNNLLFPDLGADSLRLYTHAIIMNAPFLQKRSRTSIKQLIKHVGQYTVTYTATSATSELPSGVASRLLWYKMVSDIIIKDATHIDFGDSLLDLIKELGITIQRGTRSTLKIYAAQFINLLEMSINIESSSNSAVHTKDEDMPETYRSKKLFICNDVDLVADSFDTKTGNFNGKIEYSKEFRELIKNDGGVPGDSKIVLELAKEGSPLAMDIYFWANYKNFLMKRRNISFIPLTWNSLAEQFSSSSVRMDNFKRDFKNAYSIVQKHYRFTLHFPEKTKQPVKLFRSNLSVPVLTK
ncbi:hypothetical protein GCM10023116_15870 [Kistimonas scapharcae]|uniref:Uncharacterized protein n=1 Tax=Kistimonas scapharcae TaxID=1036133 RepID=A0ABP8V1L7_9GAMM